MTRTVTNKTSHLGRAGEFAAMSEILARGWNVAIPEVDMGSDVFVAQDDGTRLTRVQVKTSQATLREGAWREVLNSDAHDYGGSGTGNFGSALAEPIPSHGFPASMAVTLPPLGAVWFASPDEPPTLPSVEPAP